MADTISFTAAKSGTIHDGTSMIVLNEGKKTVAPDNPRARKLLKDGGFIKGKVTESKSPKPDDGKVAEPAPVEFELEGFTFRESGGGWYEITGPEGFDPIKEQGEESAKALFAQAVADKVNPPAEPADGGEGGSGEEQAPA